MMVVISPHLDDAVFSCGQLLASHAGSTVISVFAGIPGNSSQLTEWDARCGFCNAREAVLTRRLEDERALSVLHARPVWLEFVDSQYGQTPSVRQVGSALRRLLLGLAPTEIVFPLGLFHSDHLLAHEATVEALRGVQGVTAAVYEDALYRGMKGILQQRLATLARADVAATPCATLSAPRSDSADGAPEKLRAVHAYMSQLRAFGSKGVKDLWQPERFWRLDPQIVTPPHRLAR
jgi:LmbE family N-acetylglucosaminyl deacetylase